MSKTWKRLSALVLSACLGLSGCGGGSDDPANTLLSLSDITGTTTLISDNTASTYTATVTDPDGIVSVTAKLDGVDLTVTASSGTYSVSTPSGMSVGSHTLVVTAIGRLPNGSNEVAVTAEVQITVQAANTVLVIGSITGADSLESINTVSTYSITPVDPDGIASVTATLDGTTLTVTESSGVYSVSTPASLAVGSHTLVFTAVGAKPDGTTETATTVEKVLSVVAADTAAPVVISTSITGVDTILNPVTVVITYDEAPIFESIALFNSGFEILFVGTPSVEIDAELKKLTITYTTSGQRKDGNGGLGGLFEVYVSVRDAVGNSTGSQLIGSIEQF